MGNFIKKIITKILLRFIDTDVLVRRIERESVNANKQKCLMGKGSVLYYPANIINLGQIEKIKIGNNTHISGELMIWPSSKGITIGDDSYIGVNSYIRSADEIIIGKGVLISHNVNIIDTDSHEIDYKKRLSGFIKQINSDSFEISSEVKRAGIVVCDNAWISYNVSILKGVTIGKGAIVGAGSIVTKDVDPFTLVAGNPAKFIKKIEPNDVD